MSGMITAPITSRYTSRHARRNCSNSTRWAVLLIVISLSYEINAAELDPPTNDSVFKDSDLSPAEQLRDSKLTDNNSSEPDSSFESVPSPSEQATVVTINTQAAQTKTTAENDSNVHHSDEFLPGHPNETPGRESSTPPTIIEGDPTPGSNVSDDQNPTSESKSEEERVESLQEKLVLLHDKPGTTPSEEDIAITTTPALTTTPTPPIADGVDLSQHDMMDFEDYRKVYLEKDPKPNGNGRKGEASTSNGHTASYNMRPNVKLRNYASSECGAKIISSTKDGAGAQSVLDENKDEYLNQPCSSKKWVTVELCEPVQVRRIELANLEPFSSTFQNFSIYISRLGTTDRQGKEWQLVGSFQAKEERSVQMFYTPDLPLFTSFVKVEFHSHYGKEHYCPITSLRVFGVAVDDEDDDDDDDDVPTSELTNETTDNSHKETEVTNPNDEDNLKPIEVDSSDLIWSYLPTEECSRSFTTWLDVPPQCHCTATVNISTVISEDISSRRETEPVSKTESQLPNQPSSSQDMNETDVHTPVTVTNSSLPEPTSSNISQRSTATVTVMAIPEPGLQADKEPIELQTDGRQAEERNSVVPPINRGDEEEFADPPEILPLPISPTEINNPDEDTNTAEQQATLDQDAGDESQIDDGDQEREDSPPTVVEEEEEEEVYTDESTAPPLSSRNKRLSPIGKLSNRVSELESNVTLTTRYLEEMSRKYKNQKEELQKALNRTMKTLQNVTVRFEDLSQRYSQLSQDYVKLANEVEKLQRQLNYTEGFDSFSLMIVIAGIGVIMIICCRRPRDLTRHQIEEIIASMPAQPRIHERRGSEGTIEFTNSANDSKSIRLKKCISTVELKSFRNADDDLDTALSQHTLSEGLSSEPSVPRLERKAAATEIQHDQENEGISDDASIDRHVEIVLPTRWRTFDTPDSKKNRPDNFAPDKSSTNSSKSSRKKSRGDQFTQSYYRDSNGIGTSNTNENSSHLSNCSRGTPININSQQFTSAQTNASNNSADRRRKLLNNRAPSAAAGEYKSAKSNGQPLHSHRKASLNPQDGSWSSRMSWFTS